MDQPIDLDELERLSIFALIESNTRRSSHESNSNQQKPAGTPASYLTDLSHYQEHFSKLRFSYVEQVTKEHFLKAITSDPPVFVTAAENAELEEQLKQDKAALKENKLKVRNRINEIGEQGRQVVRKYEDFQLWTTQFVELPDKINNLRETIEILKQQQEPESHDPDMRMPLQQTMEALQDRQDETAKMDLEIEKLQAALASKQSEAQKLQEELEPIKMRKAKAEEEAEEAKRRRGNGGMADELEERARWLRGVEGSLRAMLEV